MRIRSDLTSISTRRPRRTLVPLGRPRYPSWWREEARWLPALPDLCPVIGEIQRIPRSVTAFDVSPWSPGGTRWTHRYPCKSHRWRQLEKSPVDPAVVVERIEGTSGSLDRRKSIRFPDEAALLLRIANWWRKYRLRCPIWAEDWETPDWTSEH